MRRRRARSALGTGIYLLVPRSVPLDVSQIAGIPGLVTGEWENQIREQGHLYIELLPTVNRIKIPLAKIYGRA